MFVYQPVLRQTRKLNNFLVCPEAAIHCAISLCCVKTAHILGGLESIVTSVENLSSIIASLRRHQPSVGFLNNSVHAQPTSVAA